MTSGTPSVIMAPAHHQKQQQLLLTPSTSVNEEPSSPSDDHHVTNGTAQESSSCTTSPVSHQTSSRTQAPSSPLLTSGRMPHPRSNHRASPDSRRTPSPLLPTCSAHKTTKTVISVANATNVLVKVRAQVMTRDDSTGLWKTVSGGGPSDVVLLKRSLDQASKPSPSTSPSSSLSHTGHSNRPPVPLPRTSIHQSQGCTSRESLSLVEKKSPHLSTSDGNEINKTQSKPSSCLRYEYVIVGTRISDKNVVLYCSIKRDFVYNRATPTFHHWVSGNNKFGLTFSTANSATSFHKVVTEAFRDIVINEGSLNNLPLHENEDEDIFMPLELPLHQSSSSCSPRSGLSSCIHQRNPSTASTTSSSSKRGSGTSASSNESFKKAHSNTLSKDASKSSETRRTPTTYDRSPPVLPRMMPKTIPPEMEDYRETAMDPNKSSSSSQRQMMNSMVKPISGDLKIEEVIERINASGFSRHQVHPSNDYSYPLVNQKFSKSSSSPSVIGGRDFPSPTSNQSSKFRVKEFSNLGITECSPTKDWRSNGTKSGTLRITSADPPLPTKRIRRTGFFARLFQRNNNNNHNHHYKCNKRSMSRSTSLSAVPKGSGDKQDTCTYLQCRYCLEYYSPNGLSAVGVSTISHSVERKTGDQNSNQLRESRRRLNVTRKSQAEFQQQQRQRMDCEYAPDRLLSCINYMTCVCCASGLLYHCIEKDEDDSGGPSAFDITHSSSASSSDSTSSSSRRASEGPTSDGVHGRSEETRKMHRKSNRKRCILWTLLCIFVPCLWCYPCLKGCHSSVKERSCIFSLEPCSCCVDFCVGGKHEPLSPESSSS